MNASIHGASEKSGSPRRRHVYGPVPSRRLGMSLGVDLVPYKTCTYDCVYCQLGRTTVKTVTRGTYTPAGEILEDVLEKLRTGGPCDTISIAGSGEPSLNSNMDEIIRGIKRVTQIPVAVLTNGSLLYLEDVQEAMMAADIVLPSLDAGTELVFQWVNRPHEQLTLERVVNGLSSFTRRFRGSVWLEVLLLEDVTGIPAQAEKIAGLVREISPARTQLNTVFRPPAELFARAVPLAVMHSLASLFPGPVDVLTRASTESQERGCASFQRGERDILDFVSRRPATAIDVSQGLGMHLSEALKLLEKLCRTGAVKQTSLGGSCFYSVASPS